MATFREVVGILRAIVRAIDVNNTPAPQGAMLQSARQLLAEADRGLIRPVPWTPFQRADAVPRFGDYIAKVAAQFSISREQAKEWLDDAERGEIWVNSRYQVLIRRDTVPIWLSVKRLDQEQIHSWRDLQRIKNELVGPEHEAVELYPAESRRVDQSNQYHLWVSPDPKERFPFGFTDRQVSGESGVLGEAQTPFEDGSAK